jgi:uncharacterized protein (TIGR03435 family)
MHKLLAISGILAILMVQSRADAAGPIFEVASVRLADPGEANPGDIPRNMDNSPGHFIMRNVPLRHALEWAWDLKDYEVSGPDWIKAENRYDIIANAPGPAPENDMRLMLRMLLTERFQMKLHRETKNLDVYALLPGKSAPKVKEAAADEQTALGAGTGGTKFTKQPISRFTFMLTRRMDRPAIDLTGLKGVYDFTVDLSGLGFNGNPPDDTSAPSIFTTVPENLGLRLEAQKSPIEILVVDHAEKVPTAN